MVRFDQIKDGKDTSEKDGFGITVILSFIILGMGMAMIKLLNINPLVSGLTMIALAWFARPLARKFFGDFAKKNDIIGELIFETENISWTNDSSKQVIKSADISSINLNYNYVQGLQFVYRDIIHNGLALLTISTDSNQILKIKFLIKTTDQLSELLPIWKEYYKQGIKIKESMGKYDVKTILFEQQNLTFEKMQELKKELNVDNFY